MSKIALIGTGVMGAPLGGHLLRNGHEVKAYNRSPERLQKAAKEYGFQACNSIAEACEGCEFILTMVGYPADVEEVYLTPGGILDSAMPGAVLVDLTTSSPALADKLNTAAQKRGFQLLDCPVSGGDKGAKLGTLVIMCGGDKEAFAKALPVLQCFSKSVTLLGPAGSGQHCKACNQIAVAGATSAYSEVIAYARRVGLAPEAVFSVIAGGAAGSWQIENMAPRALSGDHDPGFFIKHFVKDMRIARDEAAARGLELPMMNRVLALYEEMENDGLGDLGTQALIRRYEKN